MNKVINISSNGIKQAIDDLVNENEMLQDKVYKLEDIINELEKWLLEENKKKQKWYNEQLLINDKKYYEERYLTSLTMINVFFDKLQELKKGIYD